MTFFDPDFANPDIPVCEKHNFKGYQCFMCRAEEISKNESITLIAYDMANKLETLLIACKTTNAHILFPFSFEDATRTLQTFKELMK